MGSCSCACCHRPCRTCRRATQTDWACAHNLVSNCRQKGTTGTTRAAERRRQICAGLQRWYHAVPRANHVATTARSAVLSQRSWALIQSQIQAFRSIFAEGKKPSQRKERGSYHEAARLSGTLSFREEFVQFVQTGVRSDLVKTFGHFVSSQ